jgi:hypothetical protein
MIGEEEWMTHPNDENISMQLWVLERQGWRHLQNEESELARQTFLKGAALAREHKQHCYELFFEYNICQVYVYYTYDQKAAVDYAVRLTTRLHRPEFKECTYQQTSVYDILTHAYFYRDCLGYEQEIRDSADYIEKELPMLHDVQLRLDYLRAELEYENGNYQAARDRVMQYLVDAEFAHAFRRSDGYLVGRRVMFALGDIPLAYQYTKMDADVSRNGGYQRGVADALLWQAVCAKQMGNDGEAQRLFQQGITHYQHYNMPHTLMYFDAVAEYHELCGERERALTLRESQFDELPARGSLHDVALAHLQYCRLLGRMGKPVDDALQKAREFIQTLRKPDVHDKALNRIVAKDYYQFDWQRK